MEKIRILGNNPNSWWIKDLNLDSLDDNNVLIKVNDIPINNNKLLADYVNSLPKDIECLIIDADSIENPRLPFAIALYVRLSLYVCRKTSFSQIYIVSDLDIDTYKDFGVLSMLLMTKKINLIRKEDVAIAIETYAPMTSVEFVEGFLNLIKIEPQEKVEGRHSIANEWGAYILSKAVGVDNVVLPIEKSYSTPYFLYSSLISLNSRDVDCIVNNKEILEFQSRVVVEERFSYLLIDDEASKGWSYVLEAMLPNAKGDVWNKQVKSFNEIDGDIRSKIENRKYDIIFLDLRMNGISEDKITNPEKFSGMEILRRIKSINPGIQVIMLTASNKGWNVKALMDAGADGYYMKESPEYHFTSSYSIDNARILSKTIVKCFNRSFLATMWHKMTEALEKLKYDENLIRLYRAIDTNWHSGFILLSQGYYRESLMQFIMALEAYANHYTFEEREECGVVYTKDVDFKSDNKDDWESVVYERNLSYFKGIYGVFSQFQKNKRKHLVNITIEDDTSNNRFTALTLPLKIAAVMDLHLSNNALKGIDKVCELIFIRNNRLAHHGVMSEYDEKARPITDRDCTFIFDLTYNLLMAD